MCCKRVYHEYCTLSLADCDFFVVVISPWIHSALSGYFRSVVLRSPSLWFAYSQSSRGRRAQNHMHVAYNVTTDACGI